MPKLNQILAIEKGTKTQVYGNLTEADKILSKLPLLSGISRVYKPRNEDGEQFPNESTLVQVKAKTVLNTVKSQLEDLWNITATKEWANCSAKADVKLEDGTVIISQVPVSYLLFLDKQLTDIRTLISRTPILDPAHSWEFDSASNVFKSNTVETFKTKKTPRALVKYDATPEHPAQTEIFTEDVVVGNWETTLFSGAIQAKERSEMVGRVDQLLRAVKIAREEANSIDVTKQDVASGVLDFIFS